MKRNVRRLVLVFGGFVTILLVAEVLVVLPFGRMPPTSLPNPNGYDDLINAGQTVKRTMDGFAGLANLDHDALEAFVATNAEALRLLRVGLSRPCTVPTDASIATFAANSGDLIALKSLGWLLSAEGRLAEMENRPTDAARSYLDAIRLGNQMSHGGLMINRLVGVACEGIGNIAMVKLLPKLTCDQMRPLVEQLEQIDGSAVTWREVLRNEDRFVRAQTGNYPNPIKLAADLWNARSMRKSAEVRHDLAVAHLRLLTTELALRCCRCDQGLASGNLEQLLPKYLRRMPPDPFSGAPLVYKQAGTNWLLYSVGLDGIDDGGKPVGKTISDDFIGLGVSKSSGDPKNKGDVLYDSPW